MKRAIAATFAVGIVAGWNGTNVGAIAQIVADEYGIALATVGLLTTALFAAHLAMQIPGGRASDRFGAKRVGFLGLALIGAGAGISMIAPELALGLAGRVVAGAGTGLSFIAAVAYLRTTGGSAFLQGLFGGVSLAASGLAIAVVPQLEGPLGWRASYWSALAIAVLALVLLAAAPTVEAAVRRAGQSDTALRELFSDPRLYRLAAVYGASLGLSVVVANWVVEIVTRQGDVDLKTAGAVGAITLLVSVVTRPLGGWILHVFPRYIRVAVGLSLISGALGTLALLVAEPIWLVAIGGVLLGIGAGIPFSPSFTGAAVTRPDAPAAAVGLVNSAPALVTVVGVPLLGLSFALPGDGRIGFAIIVVLWLVALAVLPSRRALGGEAVAGGHE
jgi:NNP family nitrate/nitrite transporter-like MFS transporter